MSDRELLELAAKAAGIEGKYFGSDNPIHTGIYQARGEYYWNPLISDSEALRLAVKLGLQIDSDLFNEMACCWRIGGDGEPEEWTIMVERHGDDPLAATRRAIVRAAAEIGRTK